MDDEIRKKAVGRMAEEKKETITSSISERKVEWEWFLMYRP